MNLIINSSPKELSRSVSGTLAEHLAAKLGGPSESIKIYGDEQKYFDYNFREDWIKQVIASERIIIPVAMWNFTIPAALKDFLDKISKEGRLWKMDSDGHFIGLLSDRPVYVIMTTGGYYPQGSTQDFVVPYLRTFFSFVGICQVRDFRLGGVSESEERIKDEVYMKEAAQTMLKTFGLL